MELDASQVHCGRTGGNGHKLEFGKLQLTRRNYIFKPWVWSKAGKDCPERLWKLPRRVETPSLEILDLDWTRSWASCSKLELTWVGVGREDFWRSFPEVLASQINYLSLCFYKGTLQWPVQEFLTYYHCYWHEKNYKLLFGKQVLFLYQFFPSNNFPCMHKRKLKLWNFGFRVNAGKISMIWTVKPSYKNLTQNIIVIMICKVLVCTTLWLTKLRYVCKPNLKYMFHPD